MVAKIYHLVSLLIISMLSSNIVIHCQYTTLPPNVTNILNQLLEQSLAINQNVPSSSSNSTPTPSNLSEIVRIFVQFLVAMFNAFTRIFAQSPFLNDKIVYSNSNSLDSIETKSEQLSPLSSRNDTIAKQPSELEKILETRRQEFDKMLGSYRIPNRIFGLNKNFEIFITFLR